MSRPVLIVVHQHLKTVPGGLQVFTLFFKLCANGFTQCRIPWGKRRGLPKMCPIYHACKRQDSDGIMESLESWNHSMMMESWTVTNISCMQEPHQAFCSQGTGSWRERSWSEHPQSSSSAGSSTAAWLGEEREGTEWDVITKVQIKVPVLDCRIKYQ
jgi:hypothetical protein